MHITEQSKYIPADFAGLYLGMTLDEFKQVKDISKLLVDENEYVSYYTEVIDTETVEAYVYQFDKDKILYEMIIEFKIGYDTQTYLSRQYGKSNNGEEWLFEIAESFKIKIWRFINNFCIANAGYFE